MRLGSLFSGIEGFGLGFERAGFKIQWQVEQDAFCNRVLRNHWPAVPRHTDVCKVGALNLSPVDCITASVPCQDVSIAGKRAGLAGKRTGLFYEFTRIVKELRPAWFVFENVPGLLSSNGGRDFAEILRVLMVECGYGVSWRVLDSRYFGVAQRRRRVFVVGRFGRSCPAEILFESESGKGNPAASRETREDIAGALAAGAHPSGFNGQDAYSQHIVAGTLNTRHSTNGHGAAGPRCEDIPNLIAAPLSCGSHVGSHAPGRRREDDYNLVCNALSPVRGGPDDNDAQGNHLVAATLPACRRLQTDGNRDNLQVAYALRSDPGGIGQGHNTTFVPDVGPQERAMHFGGHKTGNAEHNGDAHAVSAPSDSDRMRDFARLPEGMDSARYRALGNAVTVQVAEWIARRIIQFT